jgi:hypothetical protein
MPACSNCGKDTELHYHGLPMCVDCSASGVVPDHVLPERKAENSSVEPTSETPSSDEPVE